jgi:hypothetical protein
MSVSSENNKLLKNHLNIKTLFYKNTLNFHSIEFCFLYLTSATFRNKSQQKQKESLSKLRNSLGTQITNIFDSKIPSQNKTLLTNYNDKLQELFLDEDHNLYEEFLFIIEKIVKSHKFIIFENNSFYTNHNQEFKSSDKILFIHKKKDNQFYPVFTNDDQMIFNKKNETVELIQSFLLQKEDTTKIETYNEIIPEVDNEVDNEDNTIIENTVIEEIDNNKNTLFIVDEDDITFTDLDDDFVIKYNNKSYLQKFSVDEQVIYIQNLFFNSKSKYDKASGKAYLSMIENMDPVQKIMYDLNPTKVASVQKKLEDYEQYIDEFEDFKRTFPDRQFYNSVYYQDTIDNSNSTNIMNNEDIHRNSFTTSFEGLDNSITDVDQEDCMELFSKPKLDVVMKYYKVELKGSKIKLCEALISYNFIEKEIIERVSANIKLSKLRDIALENDVSANTKTFNTQEKIIKLFIDQNFISFTYPFFTLVELQSIANEHNMTVYDDFEKLINSLVYANLLLLSNGTQPKTTCDIDDHVTAIMAANDEPITHRNSQLETFRTLPQDNIIFNGFYFNGNKNSKQFETFDVENYFNILNNLSKFLPLKCELYYFDGSVLQGTIAESIQKNSLLKVKTDENEITYYNLKNIHNNKFFLYTEMHESYKYSKHDINNNIFFYINTYPYNEMLKFVSMTLDEYLQLFKTNVESLDSINHLLHKFGTTFNDLNFSDFEAIVPYIQKEENVDIEKDFVETETNVETKTSVHDFLGFNNENVSDLKKMFLLHSQNYFQMIHDIYKEKYAKHDKVAMDTKVTFKKNTNNKLNVEVRHTFDTFNELKEYKDQLNSVIEDNIDIDLTTRENETNKYLNNLKDVLKKYDELLEEYNSFFTAKHEKEFIREKAYSIKSKKLDGFIQSGANLINTDPNNQYTSIETIENENVSEKNELIHYLSKIVGIPLTSGEMTYITRQTSSIFVPILTKHKKTKAPNSLKTKKDISLWNHYTNLIIYASFLTLMAQHKYTTNEIFKKCKGLFSLHGFPMDDNTEKTFTKYMACVIYSLFGTSNAYFQSETFIDSQIIAVIRLIFQYNPAIKKIFDNLEHVKEDTSNKKSVINDLKPFYNTEKLSTTIKDGITNELKKDYKLHTIDSANSNTLMKADPPLQLLCPYTKTTSVDIFDKPFEKVEQMELIKQTFDELDENDYDDEITTFISDFAELLSYDFKEFVDIFIIQKDKRVKHFYHLFKFNQFYMNTLNKNEELMMPHYTILMENTIHDSTDIKTIIHNIFDSIQKTLTEIFNTTNIYTYQITAMNNDKRQLFSWFINEFKSYIQKVVEAYKNSYIDEVALKSIAEIMREEEKLQKLTRYDNLEDDQMFIFMELEKLMGITINTDTMGITDDDKENETIFQPSSDEDIPE